MQSTRCAAALTDLKPEVTTVVWFRSTMALRTYERLTMAKTTGKDWLTSLVWFALATGVFFLVVWLLGTAAGWW